MSLADYLAKNYLNADPKPAKPSSKKRKRQVGGSSSSSSVNKTPTSGLVIADDDATGWDRPARTAAFAGGSNPRDELADGPPAVAGQTAEFRKAKTSGWKTLSGGNGSKHASSKPSNDEDDDDAAAADAIIASAAADARARGGGGDDDDDGDEAGEDAPALDDAAEGALMEDGTRAGLQTAAQLAAQLKRAARRREKAEKAAAREAAAAGGNDSNAGGDGDAAGEALQHQTIFRDASGRIVNVAMKRAEMRAAETRARAAEEAGRRARRGDVQNAEEEARRRELQEARYLTVARHADDEEMNRELKARQRWNDPAATFMDTTTPATTKKGKGAGGGGGPVKPVYKGDAAPNRYGIRPGHRWDGVDRGNGFEKQYFAAQNRRKNISNLEYAWQMDE